LEIWASGLCESGEILPGKEERGELKELERNMKKERKRESWWGEGEKWE
jgi:hypothetical protein